MVHALERRIEHERNVSAANIQLQTPSIVIDQPVKRSTQIASGDLSVFASF